MKISARPRLIDLLLRLLPRDFRDRFGGEMESALDQEWKASSANGRAAKLSFFWRAMGDLLTTVPKEHLADLGSDLRYAWRTLRRQPLFVTATVLSLAIGIAATTSVLAIFEATFGRGIPGVAGQEELVNVKVSSDFEETFQLTSYPSFLDLRQSGVLSDLAGFSGMRMSWSQSEEAIPQLLSVQAVTPNYFSVLGVSASLGRLFDSVERVAGLVTGALGLVGLFLTAVGLYGVLAHMVSSRASEIGVRMSLGARPRDIVAMVLRSGLKLALLGLALGWVVAGLASRGLVSFLYGLSPFDAWTYASIAILLLGTAALAGYVPARRATRIDPLRVLRRE